MRAVVIALALVGCTEGATADLGLDSRMRIAGAAFVRGPTPSLADGPSVASVRLETNTIWPGYANKPIGGALDPTATAAALAMSGDSGYWIVSAGPADFSTPTLPSFQATASFARALLPGAYTLETRAVDAAGRFGPPDRQILTGLAAAPSSAGVPSDLVVMLTWDTEADIDLHVVDPLGREIYHGDATTLDTFSPGGSAQTSYGFLDADSNGNCSIDGLRQESVIWVGIPPGGRYLVRVDTASLCGQPIARFAVRVSRENAPVAVANGVCLDTDTWGPHDRGAGILVLSFDVP